MSSVAYAKSIPVVAEPDVLVCGTGLAGLGAAVSAARLGASVWAVDRMGFAGGFFTNVIGSAFDGFVYEPTGRPVVGGLVFEMLERMGVIPLGTGVDHTYNVNGDFTEVEKHPERLIPRCDPERFKRGADEILLDAGVHPLFHTQVADVLVEADRIDSVILSSKAGLVAIRPKVVIPAVPGGGQPVGRRTLPFRHIRSAGLEPGHGKRHGYGTSGGHGSGPRHPCRLRFSRGAHRRPAGPPGAGGVYS
jgi:NADPH-dependent 2,4-dienoyl-CoA reductase/sulfur reductase-like enzyme